ncbi:MAG: hypothetical protein VB137_02415 [Burkholderia sp.]
MPPASPNLASSAVQAAQAVKVLQEQLTRPRAAPAAAPIRPVVPPIAQPARTTAAQNLPARTQSHPVVPAQNANAALRRRPTPLYAWSDKPAQPVEPSPNLQDTLRSIDASTAQWVALASTAAAPRGDAAGEVERAAAETAPAAAPLDPQAEMPLAFEMATPADAAAAPIANKADDSDAVIDISAFMPANAPVASTVVTVTTSALTSATAPTASMTTSAPLAATPAVSRVAAAGGRTHDRAGSWPGRRRLHLHGQRADLQPGRYRNAGRTDHCEPVWLQHRDRYLGGIDGRIHHRHAGTGRRQRNQRPTRVGGSGPARHAHRLRRTGRLERGAARPGPARASLR